MKNALKAIFRWIGLVVLALVIGVVLILAVMFAISEKQDRADKQKLESLKTEITDSGELRIINNGTSSAGDRGEYRLTVSGVIEESRRHAASHYNELRFGWDFRAVSAGETYILVDLLGGGDYYYGADIYRVMVDDQLNIAYEMHHSKHLSYNGNKIKYDRYFDSAQFTSGGVTYDIGKNAVNDMFGLCFGSVLDLTKDSGVFLSPESPELEDMDRLEIHDLYRPEDMIFGELPEPYLTTDKVYFDRENRRLYVLRDDIISCDWYKIGLDSCITIEMLETALR